MRFPQLITATILASTLCAFNASAQSFEGVIEFTKSTGPVSTMYKYYVKDDFVRIEELSEKGVIQGIMLVDNHDRRVVAISPERKLYMDVPNMRLPKDVDVQVQKTAESKQVAGYKCKKWVVSNASADRKVTYWVADDAFDFFIPMLRTLNRKDEQAVYFLEIPEAGGVFTMQGVETKSDGSVISTLEVKKIAPQKLADELFRIPSGFTKFERN